jgi:monoterpene epsilon-lactone hydrolase
MASWQAHLFSALYRLTLKPRLKRARDIARIRILLAPKPSPLPRGVRLTPGEVGGMPGEWAESANTRGLLLYIHGGGFIACSVETHRPITCYLAQLGFRVFAPSYRLAPENPFPAAIHDLIEVFLAMVGDPPLPVALAGDSAGGGLALSLMLSLRDAGRPLPTAAALFSPWTDLACTGESILNNEKTCALFTAGGLHEAAKLYLAGAPANDPLASPHYAKLTKLPPLLIHVSADETLLDDSTRLAEHARHDGVPVQLKVWPVVPHGWQLLAPRLPEARQSLSEAADFLTGGSLQT